jgi:hypothetical protein
MKSLLLKNIYLLKANSSGDARRIKENQGVTSMD